MSAEREYVVLHEREGAWHPLARWTGRSADDAIRAIAEGAVPLENGAASATLIAIPATHWRPCSVRVTQAVQVELLPRDVPA